MSSDETHHWYAATCEHTEEKKGEAEHIKVDGTTVEAATTEKKGKIAYTCPVCKRELYEEIPQIPIAVSSEKPLAATLETENLKATTSLRLIGTLSDDDFKTLREMTTLVSLDITEVTNDNIPIEAFKESSFKTIQLPSGLKTINNGAFNGSSLTELIIPEGVKEIGDSILLNSKHLTKLVIPGTVEKVGQRIIQVTSADSLGNIYFEDGIPDVTVILNEGIKELSPSTFCGSAVKEVIIPTTVTVIPESCFALSRLEKISLPNSITKIDRWAFERTNLTELIIPEGVKEIGNSILFNSKHLTKLVIPGTVEKVGRWILEVPLEDGIPDVTLILNEGIKELAPSAFWGSAVKEVVIPSTVTVIPDWCFSNSRLEKITFHDGITRIGGWAFENCKLQFEDKLIVPKSVKVLGPFAFYLHLDVSNEIVLNEGLEVIYQDAMVLGIDNKTLEIPASVNKLYRGALILENGLDSVVFKGETPPEYCNNFDPFKISYNKETGEYVGPPDEGPSPGNPPPSINIKEAEKYKNLKAYVPAGSLEAYKIALETDTDFEPFKVENILVSE